MEVDFKITAWERVQLPENEKQRNQVLEEIKKGNITSSAQMIEYCEKEFNEDVSWSILTESEEQMSVEENDGKSTIDLVDLDTEEPSQIIWDNTQLYKQDTIAVKWGVVDVLSQVHGDEGEELTEQEAREILLRLKTKHDGNIGISWEVIRDYVTMYLDDKKKESNE